MDICEHILMELYHRRRCGKSNPISRQIPWNFYMVYTCICGIIGNTQTKSQPVKTIKLLLKLGSSNKKHNQQCTSSEVSSSMDPAISSSCFSRSSNLAWACFICKDDRGSVSVSLIFATVSASNSANCFCRKIQTTCFYKTVTRVKKMLISFPPLFDADYVG